MSTLHTSITATLGAYRERAVLVATSLGFVLAFALVAVAGLHLSIIRDGLQDTAMRAAMALGAVAAACVLWWVHRHSNATVRSLDMVLLADATMLLGPLVPVQLGIGVVPASWLSLALAIDVALVAVACGSLGSALFEIRLSEAIVREARAAGFCAALHRSTVAWRPVMVASLVLHAALVPCFAGRGAIGMALIWCVVLLVSLWPALSRSARRIGVAALVAIVAAVLFANTVALERWLNAAVDPYADGYMWHAFAHVLRGSAFGHGTGFGEALLLVPVHDDDMVLAEVADVFGTLGLSIVLLAALGGICWAAWSVRMVPAGQRAVAAGLLAAIAAPLLLNACDAFHVVPFFAVPFPLLSVSSAAWIAAPFAMTLLALVIGEALPSGDARPSRDALPPRAGARSRNGASAPSEER